MARGSNTYKGTTPTLPRQSRVQDPAAPEEDERWEGEPTQQACPLCLRAGYVSPEVAMAFEAFCASLRGEQ